MEEELELVEVGREEEEGGADQSMGVCGGDVRLRWEEVVYGDELRMERERTYDSLNISRHFS